MLGFGLTREEEELVFTEMESAGRHVWSRDQINRIKQKSPAILVGDCSSHCWNDDRPTVVLFLDLLTNL